MVVHRDPLVPILFLYHRMVLSTSSLKLKKNFSVYSKDETFMAASPRKPNAPAKRSVEDRIVSSLKNFSATLKKTESTKRLPDKFTCRKITLNLKPTAYKPADVKRTRGLLGCSQAVFALVLGVSPKTVRAWEQGVNSPNEMACRFMDEIRYSPDYWRLRLQESTVAKDAS